MNWRQGLRLGLLALFIYGIDFVSKGAVHFYLRPFEHAPSFFPFGGISVFQDFHGIDFCIHHVTNRGAAWGVGGNWQDLILWIRVAVVIGLIGYLFYSKKAHEYRYPLTMVVAGGMGNIVDYFLYGHVIDMFHFFFWGYSYPVFNVADTAIFIGIVWLLGHSLFNRKKTEEVENVIVKSE